MVIRDAGARFVGRDLQAEAAELAQAPVDHQRVAARAVVGEKQRQLCRAQSARHRAVAQAVVSIAHAPARHELVHRLRIPARLATVVAAGNAGESEIAVLVAPEIFALHLKVRYRGVAVRCPFRDDVRDPERARAGERGADVHRTLGRRGVQVRKSGAPRRRFADVAAEMAVERPQAGAIAVGIAGGKAARLKRRLLATPRRLGAEYRDFDRLSFDADRHPDFDRRRLIFFREPILHRRIPFAKMHS